jgi:hypothetical protein
MKIPEPLFLTNVEVPQFWNTFKTMIFYFSQTPKCFQNYMLFFDETVLSSKYEGFDS